MQRVKASVAVVGSGVAGLTAAHLLRRRFDVTLYEADDRFGGHARTRRVGPDAIETGFMVFNQRTSPLLSRLLDELDVTTSATEASLGFRCDGCGLEFADRLGPHGITAGRRRILDRRWRRRQDEVTRFRAAALDLAKSLDPSANQVTYGEFLDRLELQTDVLEHYALPLTAFVWWAEGSDPRHLPAVHLLGFLRHQGLLSQAPPSWRIVDGGSRTYVDAITALLRESLSRTSVTSVTRSHDGVTVTTARHAERFDHVIMATHADDALRLLSDPTPDEREVLGAFSYQRTRVTLHRDLSVLPRAARARGAWNVTQATCSGDARSVAHWMNRVQGLDPDRPAVVELGLPGTPEPVDVLDTATFAHPIVDRASALARRRLPLLNSGTTVFAGAHHGWGFHEDGCRSGVAAAAHVGVGW